MSARFQLVQLYICAASYVKKIKGKIISIIPFILQKGVKYLTLEVYFRALPNKIIINTTLCVVQTLIKYPTLFVHIYY